MKLYKLIIPVYFKTKEAKEYEEEMEKENKAMGKEEDDFSRIEEMFTIIDVIIYTDGRLEIVPYYFDKYFDSEMRSIIRTPIDHYYSNLTPTELSALIDKQMLEQFVTVSSKNKEQGNRSVISRGSTETHY